MENYLRNNIEKVDFFIYKNLSQKNNLDHT